MNIVVCIKRVPFIQEVDLVIDGSGKDVEKEMLAFILNEWDNYAIEEAVLIKEKLGGTVTAITIGFEEDEEVLRKCLAMGADKAIRIDPGTNDLDGFVISNILAKVIGKMEYDLIMTGVQADDDNHAMVGIMLAEQLGLPHAAVVNGLETAEGEATVKVELEGGMDQISKIRLPALLSIQTGINEPRYVSIMGLRKARQKELDVLNLDDLGLTADELSRQTFVEEAYLPPETEGAEILSGEPAEVAEKILSIISERGVSI